MLWLLSISLFLSFTRACSDSTCGFGFACNGNVCYSVCTTNDQCQTGFQCAYGKCNCQSDSSCKGYLCTGDGFCGSSCVTNTDCASGYLCQPSNSQCVKQINKVAIIVPIVLVLLVVIGLFWYFYTRRKRRNEQFGVPMTPRRPSDWNMQERPQTIYPVEASSPMIQNAAPQANNPYANPQVNIPNQVNNSYSNQVNIPSSNQMNSPSSNSPYSNRANSSYSNTKESPNASQKSKLPTTFAQVINPVTPIYSNPETPVAAPPTPIVAPPNPIYSRQSPIHSQSATSPTHPVLIQRQSISKTKNPEDYTQIVYPKSQ